MITPIVAMVALGVLSALVYLGAFVIVSSIEQ